MQFQINLFKYVLHSWSIPTAIFNNPVIHQRNRKTVNFIFVDSIVAQYNWNSEKIYHTTGIWLKRKMTISRSWHGKMSKGKGGLLLLIGVILQLSNLSPEELILEAHPKCSIFAEKS